MGVNPSANGMWLVCADDGKVLSTVPYRLSMPSGMESGQKLIGLLDECERVLRDLAPDRIVVLDPEPTARMTFSKSRPRVTAETLLALAAARADLPFGKVSRAAVRSRLGLPKSGGLPTLVPATVERLDPHWKGKRDLAALAALAGSESLHAEG